MSSRGGRLGPSCMTRIPRIDHRSSSTARSDRSAARSSSGTWTSAPSAARCSPTCEAIHDAAASLEPLAPPDGVWLQIAGRLRQEGRVALPPARPARRRGMSRSWRSPRRSLLAVGASIVMLLPQYPSNNAGAEPRRSDAGAAAAGNAARRSRRPKRGDRVPARRAALPECDREARTGGAARSGPFADRTAAHRSADGGDAPEEPAGDRSGDRRKPVGAADRSRRAQPARDSLFDALRRKVGAPAGHDRADERNAQRQFCRRGPDRRRREQIIAEAETETGSDNMRRPSSPCSP